MKLLFHKNLEHHLVKNGFEFINHNELSNFSTYRKNWIKIKINFSEKFICIYYYSKIGHWIPIKGCKTLNDLYRLEKLIEGNTNQK